MSVEVLTPQILNGHSASPSPLVNGGTPDAATPDGNELGKSKFITGMIYPPPDIRSEFCVLWA